MNKTIFALAFVLLLTRGVAQAEITSPHLASQQESIDTAAASVEHGTGFDALRTLGSRSCWRKVVMGDKIYGDGNLSVDPWEVAGIKGGDPGALPCQRPEVETAYEARYVAGCIGPHSPLGGWCSGISNEAKGRGKTALEWACLNHPEMIGSTGTAGGWDCKVSGRDLTDMGAFGDGYRLLLKIEAEMGSGPPRCDPPKVCIPPPPPSCDAPKVCILPCPPPTCIPPQVKATACACESWTLVGWRKTRCREACAWAKTLPVCHQSG